MLYCGSRVGWSRRPALCPSRRHRSRRSVQPPSCVEHGPARSFHRRVRQRRHKEGCKRWNVAGDSPAWTHLAEGHILQALKLVGMCQQELGSQRCQSAGLQSAVFASHRLPSPACCASAPPDPAPPAVGGQTAPPRLGRHAAPRRGAETGRPGCGQRTDAWLQAGPGLASSASRVTTPLQCLYANVARAAISAHTSVAFIHPACCLARELAAAGGASGTVLSYKCGPATDKRLC